MSDVPGPAPEAVADGEAPTRPPSYLNNSLERARRPAASSSPSSPRDLAAASFEGRLNLKASGSGPEAIVDDVGPPPGAHAAASRHDDSLEKARAAGAPPSPGALPAADRVSHSDESGVGPAGPHTGPYADDSLEKARASDPDPAARISHSDESGVGPSAPFPRPDDDGGGKGRDGGRAPPQSRLASWKSDDTSEDVEMMPGRGDYGAAAGMRIGASADRAASASYATPLPRTASLAASLPRASEVPEDQVYHGFVVTDDPVYEAVMLLPGEDGDWDGPKGGERRPCWVRYNILIVLVMILVGTAINLWISLGTRGRASGEPVNVIVGTGAPTPAPCLDDVLLSDADGDGRLDLAEYTDMVSGWSAAGCPPREAGGPTGGGDGPFLLAMAEFDGLVVGDPSSIDLDPPSIALSLLSRGDGLDGLCLLKGALLRGHGIVCAGGPPAAGSMSGVAPPDDDGMMDTPRPTPFATGGVMGTAELRPPVDGEGGMKAEPDDDGTMVPLLPIPTPRPSEPTPFQTPEEQLVACYFDGIFDDVSDADVDGDGVLGADEFADLVSAWAPCAVEDGEVARLSKAYNGGGGKPRPEDLCALRDFLAGDGGPCAAPESAPGLATDMLDFGGDDGMMPEEDDDGMMPDDGDDGMPDNPPGLRGPSFQPSAAPAGFDLVAESGRDKSSPPDPGETPPLFPPWAVALAASLGAVILLGVPLACFVYRRGAAAGRTGRPSSRGADGRDGVAGDQSSWDRNYDRLLHFGSERVVASIPRPSREVPAGIHLVSRGKLLVVRSVDPAGPYGSRGIRAGMAVTSICGVPVAGRTPPEVVAIIRGAEGSVTVEAEAPGDLRDWLEGQRRLHARSGLGKERAKRLIEAGVLPRPADGDEGRNSPENGLDNV